jgi:hypothetical protein
MQGPANGNARPPKGGNTRPSGSRAGEVEAMRQRSMGRSWLLATGVVVAVVCGLWLGAGTASGGTSIHVVAGPGFKVAFLDQNRSGLYLGDSLAARGPLLDPNTNEQVGSSYSTCWVARTLIHNHGLYNCTYLLKLADGTIILQGLDPHGPGSSPFAVTGGSGIYKDASGDALFTDSTTATDMQITLSLTG